MMILAIIPWLITTVAAIIPTMAIAYGLSYLGGLLFGQDPKEAAEDEPRGQSFAWDPHTTQREGIPRPMCYGRNKHYGNLIMNWTGVDPISGNEILYKVSDYGRGPVQGVTGGLLSDNNRCFGGAPTFTILLDSYISNWYQTAADVNDADKTTYVGFYGKYAKSKAVKGRFKSEVEFASATLDRLEYCRYWYLKGAAYHQGYEKVSLWYEGAYHLISTKNFTTEGSSTDTIVIEAGGPWTGVTKIKIEVELFAAGFYLLDSHKNYGTVSYRLYELRAWLLEDVPVFLNGQPAHNFTEVRVQGRPGTLNQTCMEGFEQNKLEYRPRTVIVHGEPVRWTSPNKFFDDIEFTLAWLRGLFCYTDEASVGQHSVGVKVEISVRDAESWNTIMDVSISASQIKQLFKIYKVSELGFNCVHGTQYDLQFSKTTEDKSATQFGDEMQLRSVREVVDVAFTHPGRALLGVIVQATERLQGDIDITWVTDDKLVNVYNGETETWGIKWTRNRAFIYLDMVTQPVISGDGNGGGSFIIERYEATDPSRVDINFIWKWAQWCDEQVPSGIGEETEDRMPCDIICDQLTNVWSIAYEIAKIGRMSPYWQGVILTGWIDTTTDEPVDLITMDNTMARSWKSGYTGYGEMAGSVETFYKDSAQNYERKHRPVFNQNAGTYTRVVALEGVGITSESLATRVGNHVLKRNELIKNVNSVRMGREALRYKLGRVVRIQSNVPNWGQAFRVITAPTANAVQLDRVIENVAAGDLLWVRTYDTVNKKISLDSYTVQSVIDNIVMIAETWVAGCTPLKDHFAAIGIAGSIKLRRIIKMKHAVENYFDVELETYNTALFASDDADPELTNPDYVQPVTELALPVSRQSVIDLINALAVPRARLNKPQLFNCAWIGDEVDTVAWSKRNADKPILLSWEGEIYEITPGDTTLEFIYWDSETPNEFHTTAVLGTILTADYLVCTNKNGVAQSADMLQATHGAIIQVGTLIAEQIIIGGINALGLMNAPAEAGADVTGGHQGDISLANLAEKSVDSLVNGTYAKMLANWRHGTDPTKMNLGLGFAASITTAQIGLLAVHTAQIDNLAVGTIKIEDEATAILTAAQDDEWWYLDPSPMSQAGFGLYRVAVWTAEFTSSGSPCHAIFDTSVDGVDLTFVTKSMYAIFRTVDTYSELSISTITLAGSGVVKITTTAAHSLNTDDFVWLWDIVGTIELNDAICKVTVVNATEFTLQLTRSDWFTAYTSGGKVRHVDLWGLRYGHFYHVHDTGIHATVFDPYLDADKAYQYIGAIRNRNASQYAYINEGSTMMAMETKK